MWDYRAGRNVVRSALAELQHEGLISRVQGAGTFAVVRKTRHTLQGAHGLAWSVKGADIRVASRLLAFEEVVAPVGLALRLGAEPQTMCLVADVVTDIDGYPSMFVTSYIADPEARNSVVQALETDRWSGDWYDLLSRADLGPTQREVIAEAASVDSFIAPHLDLRLGEPVMRFERRLRLGARSVPEYGFSFCRGDRLAFAISDSALIAPAVLP